MAINSIADKSKITAKVVLIDKKSLKNLCNSDIKYTRLKFSETYFALYKYEVNFEIIFSNNLTQLNLSKSNLFYIPKSVFKLINLKKCRLSENNIRIISESILSLKFLTEVYLDSNKIIYLPAFLNHMPSLSLLDVYDNQIETAYCDIESLNCLDIAMNFIEEPDTQTYHVQKKIIRDKLNCTRADGCKSYLYYDGSESDENYTSLTNDDYIPISNVNFEEERWDSDEYWTPSDVILPKPNYSEMFTSFAKRLMIQGHFCPMDAHAKVVPKTVHRAIYVSGQFDDA